MAGYRAAGPQAVSLGEEVDDGTMCRARSAAPTLLGLLLNPAEQPYFSMLTPFARRPVIPVACGARATASTLTLSAKGTDLLKGVEALHLKPYDDQTRKPITAWVKGATVGYGHLITLPEWATYKDGLADNTAADALFTRDLAPFVTAVGKHLTAKLLQHEFDALVMLAFNIGIGNFSSSSVVTLINNPKAVTLFKDLEAAWKSWRKSQGKVMPGLENRRACEWTVFTQGVYQRW